MKNQKGVTLVVLVVTVIVLIILAGISINLILGDNGIITIAKRAKQNTELAKVQEEKELNELYTQLTSEDFNSENLPYDSIAKLTEFKTAIANAIAEAGGIKPDISAEITVFTNNIKGIVKEVTKDATATAEDIVEGKTAWINGIKIDGTMKKESKNATLLKVKNNCESGNYGHTYCYMYFDVSGLSKLSFDAIHSSYGNYADSQAVVYSVSSEFEEQETLLTTSGSTDKTYTVDISSENIILIYIHNTEVVKRRLDITNLIWE